MKRMVLWKILERERNELAELGRKLGGVKGAEGLRRGWIGARRPADPGRVPVRAGAVGDG